MVSEKIANRYAGALFGFALEKGQVEDIYKDMILLKEVCESNKNFTHFLSSPVINTSKKVSVFKALFLDKITPLTFLFLEILIKKRREWVIRQIAGEFLMLYKEHHHIKTVYFQTASAVNEKNVQQLKDALSKELSSKIEMIQTVNENLIGGFIFKVDDLQYDASIRRNINRLKKEYNINIYVSKF
ncbi:MAG TPA: ATP synthase F1 subunit delta [Bacteroidales bacterium]|nr:ATP synthase F1 subunit delta [Bacteroidales bacterium]